MNILILGAGNIAIRHIQGLCKYEKKKLSFYIFDIKNDYKYKFKSEIEEIKLTNNFNEIKDLDQVTNIKFELVIIATTANARVKLLKNILDSIKYRFILLEKPICNSILDLEYLKNNTDKKIFINFPRRYCEWHKNIKKILTRDYQNKVKKIKISGNNLGIACNSCHFVDLTYFWTNNKLLDVNTDNLLEWTNSKRDRFYEVIGKIKFRFENDVYLSIKSEDNIKKFKFEVFDDKKIILEIDYAKKIAKFESGLELVGNLKKQSESSQILLNLIQQNSLDICRLGTEVNFHEKILLKLIDFWNYKKKQQINEIMIT